MNQASKCFASDSFANISMNRFYSKVIFVLVLFPSQRFRLNSCLCYSRYYALKQQTILILQTSVARKCPPIVRERTSRVKFGLRVEPAADTLHTQVNGPMRQSEGLLAGVNTSAGRLGRQVFSALLIVIPKGKTLLKHTSGSLMHRLIKSDMIYRHLAYNNNII